jgi:hypothetical protein
MKKLRSLHLYLGCIFAPMMLFFTVSGLWQTYYPPLSVPSETLTILSTIHTRMGLKVGPNLANAFLRYFVLLMAVSFIFSTILGIIMAIKHGSRKTACACLAFGVFCPLALILIPYLIETSARAH